LIVGWVAIFHRLCSETLASADGSERFSLCVVAASGVLVLLAFTEVFSVAPLQLYFTAESDAAH
jgi:hypothetical protein